MKVYKFWCTPSDQTQKEILDEQFSLMRDYRYGFSKLENLKREEGMLHARRGDPDFDAAAIALESLFDVPKEARDDDELERARKRYKETYAAIKSAEWLKIARTTDQDVQRILQKDLRSGIGPSGAGLSFGTYQLCEDAHKQSTDRTPIYKRVRVGLQPREGSFAVHYQDKGTTRYSDITDPTKKSLVKISAIKEGLPRRNGIYGAARLQRVTMQIAKGRYVSVHALLHREIPKDAVITWAKVVAITVGSKRRYSLQITATHESVSRKPQDRARSVSVDIGFRHVENGYVTAVAVGSDGRELELLVPHSVTDRAMDRTGKTSKSSDLRSIRDQRLNNVKVALKGVLPNVHTWRSPKSMVRALKEPLPQETQDYLRAELKQDRHLWDWEAHNRQKMTRQINALYSDFACLLAKHYDEVRIEDVKVCSAKEAWRTAAEQAYLAGSVRSKRSLADERAALKLGTLQKMILTRGGGFGASVGEVRAAYTSRKCSTCGHCNEGSAEKMVTCSECGVSEDRDVRACRNIASAEVQKWLAGPLAEVKSTKRKTPRRKAKVVLDASSAVI